MFQHVRSPSFKYHHFHDYRKRTVLDPEEQVEEIFLGHIHTRKSKQILILAFTTLSMVANFQVVIASETQGLEPDNVHDFDDKQDLIAR